MTPVRWGVLSTSSFAEGKFLPGLRKSALTDVVAVASRDQARSTAFAERNAIPRAYGSYEELLADPAVEVIYNPLPNDLHVEWTLRAAEAGKHVLCEKPMSMHAAELDALLPHATRVHIAEGFMVRFHPQWTETRARVRSGELGRLTHAHVAFAFSNTDAENIRNIAANGGGALYDIGCYAIAAARWFFEAEPLQVVATMDLDPTFNTDRLTSGLLAFSEGRTCAFSVSTQSVAHQRVHLFGTKGRLELTVPFNHPADEPVIYLSHDGSSVHGLDAETHTVAANDQYASQGEAFSLRVRTEEPTEEALLDAIAQMQVIDALKRSVASGRFEAIPQQSA